MREGALNVSMYPLGQLPFDTYCIVLDMGYCTHFVPTNMLDDLKLGSVDRMLYWYPRYIDHLYDLAGQGINYMEWLKDLHFVLPWNFKQMFPSTVVKLDKILEKKIKIKENHFSEMKIKPSN